MAKTLLLADGSVTIQRVIELTFAHEDVRVVSMSDGRRAMAWLNTDKPDIILADVDLPETDGYAIAKHVRKTPRLKKVPILLLAGAFEPVDQERVRSIGCDGVIVKPFEPQHVVTRVRELLADLPPEKEPAGVGSRESASAQGPAAAAFPQASTVAAIRPAGAPASDLPPSIGRPSARGESAPSSGEPAPLVLEPLPQAPERLELPSQPMWSAAPAFTPAPPLRTDPLPPVAPPAPLPMAAAPGAAPAPPKVSLVNAFSALLAAEQSTLPPPPPSAPPVAAAAPAAPVMSEASVEEAVRKVLVRMTDELVRRIVVETAERLIREEIEKIRSIPE